MADHIDFPVIAEVIHEEYVISAMIARILIAIAVCITVVIVVLVSLLLAGVIPVPH